MKSCVFGRRGTPVRGTPMAMVEQARRLIRSGFWLSVVLCSGCRWIPLHHADMRLDTPSVPVVSQNSSFAPPLPLDVLSQDSARLPALEPVKNVESLAADIPRPTPLLDAAYTQVLEIQAEKFNEEHSSKRSSDANQPTKMYEREVSARPVLTEPPPSIAKVDGELLKASSLVPTSSEAGAVVDAVNRSDVISRSNPDPRVESHPTEKNRPVVGLDERWESNLQALLGLASEQAEYESKSGEPGLWSARKELVGRLLAADGSVWLTVLESLAQPSQAIETPKSGALPSTYAGEVGEIRDSKSLAIASLTFCKKVEGFGNYEPIDGAVRPGRGLGLYWEVEGLESLREGQNFRTRLSSEIEVQNLDGNVIWVSNLGQAEDICRRPRKDYFVNTRITLPETLKPGTYRLRLRLEDLIGKISTATDLEFAILP